MTKKEFIRILEKEHIPCKLQGKKIIAKGGSIYLYSLETLQQGVKGTYPE